MTDAGSALYTGTVMHQRLRPRRHRLQYRVWSLLVDIDALPALDRRLRLFSVDRFNLFSLHQRDHGDGGGSLRVYVDGRLRGAGIEAGGSVLLLTMPRILGYAFNPLSVYFCHAADGALRALLYEVNNTFGERHSYLVEVAAGQPAGAVVEQTCAKHLHVSPFLPLAMRYAFRIQPPAPGAAAMRIAITVHDGDGAVLHARYDAERKVLDDRTLAAVFLSHPLLTLKVIAAIHWQALRLLLKGVRIQPRPAAPAHPVSVTRSHDP